MNNHSNHEAAKAVIESLVNMMIDGSLGKPIGTPVTGGTQVGIGVIETLNEWSSDLMDTTANETNKPAITGTLLHFLETYKHDVEVMVPYATLWRIKSYL